MTETTANIHTALCKAQAEFPVIPKNKVAAKGTPREYKYADLPVVFKMILPCLNKNGVVYSAEPFVDGIMLMLKASLTHGDSGSFIDCSYPVCGLDLAPQQVGSALTYARRYTFSSLTGCAPDDDTDAADIGAVKGPSAAHMKRALKELDNELVDVGSMPMTMKCFQAWQDKMDKERWPEESVSEGNYRNMVRETFSVHRGRLEATEIKGDQQADEANERDPADLHPLEGG